MSRYAALVRTLVARLLVLVAVLLMPLGMGPATAAFAHPAMPMDMAKAPCPEKSSQHDMKNGIAECTMACAAALPAAELENYEPLRIVFEAVQPPAASRLDGSHPDTATPPPKHS